VIDLLGRARSREAWGFSSDRRHNAFPLSVRHNRARQRWRGFILSELSAWIGAYDGVNPARVIRRWTMPRHRQRMLGGSSGRQASGCALILASKATTIPASILPFDPAPFFREGSYDRSQPAERRSGFNRASPWFPSRTSCRRSGGGIGRSAAKEVADLRMTDAGTLADMENLRKGARRAKSAECARLGISGFARDVSICRHSAACARCGSGRTPSRRHTGLTALMKAFE